MARRLFTVERGFRMIAENGGPDSGIDILFGTGLPGGDTGPEDNSAPGSFYFRDDSPYGAYKKTGTANTTADWEEVGNVSLDQLGWRNERVFAATNDSVAPGSAIDISAWTDNESGLDATDAVVGDHFLVDVDGTPVLLEMTAKVSPTSITLAAAAQPIADNDTFVVQNYLPDSPAANEQQAIVHFPSSTGPAVKIADVNWQVASYIDLDPGYAAVNGTVSSADSVNSAIQKLDGNQLDLTTLSGVAQGSVDLGTFTGVTILDNRNTKEALQDLETALEQLQIIGKTTGITTEQTVDFVLVDAYHAVEYEIVAWEEATPANKKFVKFTAMHNGTAGADATDWDDTTHTILGLGSVGGNFLQVTASLSGAGVAQQFNLRIASNTAGLTVEWRRSSVAVQ